MEDKIRSAAAGGLVNDSLREVMRNSEDYFFVKDTELVYHGSSFVFARMCRAGRSGAAGG
jgi:hypothetical protein